MTGHLSGHVGHLSGRTTSPLKGGCPVVVRYVSVAAMKVMLERDQDAIQLSNQMARHFGHQRYMPVRNRFKTSTGEQPHSRHGVATRVGSPIGKIQATCPARRRSRAGRALHAPTTLTQQLACPAYPCEVDSSSGNIRPEWSGEPGRFVLLMREQSARERGLADVDTNDGGAALPSHQTGQRP